MLALDIMNKFRTELGFVAKATYLTDLPPGTFRQKQAFIAYVVTVTNEQVGLVRDLKPYCPKP